MWPAFWLLADHGKWPPELDVMESIGSNTNYAVQSVHSRDGNHGKTTWASENLQQGFHTYGMNWTKNSITYYIDGKQTAQYKTPSDMHTKMHILVNLAVGGTWPGSPNSSTDWSKTNYKIDYVRVYSSDPSAKVVAGGTPSNTGSGSTPPANEGGFTPSTSGGSSPAQGGTSKPGGTQAPSGNGAVVLSNAMNSSDLSDGFRAGTASRTYTASQMGIRGVPSGTTVTVSYNGDKDVTVTNNGAWSAIRNASVKSDSVGDVTLRNFVDAQIDLGDKARAINASGLKRGTITTGAGSDSITVSGKSNAGTENLLTINAGNGNNKVSYHGDWQNRVRVNTGSGSDTIAISGKVPATVKAGAGNDRIDVRTTNGVTLTGGTGRDVFSFMAGAHATITDFKSADDRIKLTGISSSNVRVRSSGGSTYIDLGSSGRITVAGAAHTANGLHLSYA
jgi:beta-glucanase (GH16 family)